MASRRQHLRGQWGQPALTGRAPLVVVGAGLLLLAWPFAVGLGGAVAAAAVAGLLVADLFLAPRPNTIGVARALPAVVGLGASAALSWTVDNPGPRALVGRIADDLAPPMLRDLEGVRYIEIPWLAEPERVTPAGPPRTPYESPLQERLYALGLDALALAQMFAEPVPPDRVELDGATGHLSLTSARTFARQGTVMVIHDGHAMPDPAGR